MLGIVLFSHGSVMCGAGRSLEEHAARLRAAGIAQVVEIGYLNYSEPRFSAAVAACKAQGARRILILPYFLVPGKFVAVDLPRIVGEQARNHPELEFLTAQPIGFDARLADAIVASADAARPADCWGEERNRSAERCEQRPRCPLFAGGACRIGESCASTPQSAPKRLTNRALLIMAHGSPDPAANDELRRLAALIRSRDLYAIVQECYLECNSPSIDQGIDLCVGQGARQIVAVPYFLHTGRHVAIDLPAILDAQRAGSPGVEFTLGTYLGRSEILTQIMLDRAREALGRE